MKKVAIIGSVGIPGNYGGFETLTEYLTKELNDKIAITVYCSSKNYKTKLKSHNGAILKYIPLKANGIQSIPYDIISLFLAAIHNESILILGISGCSMLPLFRIFFKRKFLIINIDGLEHRRDKWSWIIRKFLKFSEKMAVRYADEIIADNKAIQEYILNEYDKESRLISYGGDHAAFSQLKDSIRTQYSLPGKYAFNVCRIEPENNIKLILEAVSCSNLPIVMVGNWTRNNYSRQLKSEYALARHITLIDAIYEQDILDQIRSNCYIYIHGHSAGGTNPSLVEAMHLGLPILAYDVAYNRETTFGQAKYFKSSNDLCNLMTTLSDDELQEMRINMNRLAQEHYTWDKVSKKYSELISSPF